MPKANIPRARTTLPMAGGNQEKDAQVPACSDVPLTLTLATAPPKHSIFPSWLPQTITFQHSNAQLQHSSMFQHSNAHLMYFCQGLKCPNTCAQVMASRSLRGQMAGAKEGGSTRANPTPECVVSFCRSLSWQRCRVRIETRVMTCTWRRVSWSFSMSHRKTLLSFAERTSHVPHISKWSPHKHFSPPPTLLTNKCIPSFQQSNKVVCLQQSNNPTKVARER